MNFIDWLYINIYGQSQRLDNLNRKKIDGDLWTSSIFGISFGGLYLFMKALYYRLKFNTFPHLTETDKYITFIISLGVTLIIKWYYQKNNRSFVIFHDYIKSHKLMKRGTAFFLLMVITLLPYLLLLILMLV